MILRKPYAFIIKHFRLIHLIILACLAYSIYNISSLSGFINTLITSRIYTYAGADIYINKSIYTYLFVAGALSGVVYWLLTQKKKPTNLYLGLIIYSVGSLAAYMYIYNILGKMITEEVTVDTLSFLRDLLVLVRFPGYVFLAFCFIRGIGFNLKQFNFSKDIAELKIAEKDSEEFELMVGQNNYKYERFARRTIRETKYYIKENAVALTIIGLLLLIVLVILGIRYYNQYLKRLKAQQVSTINGITYVVNKAYITTEDFNGRKIKPGSKFVVIDMSFNNTTNEEKVLDFERIKLNYKQLVWTGTLVYNDRFIDMGQPYVENTRIPSANMLNKYIVFEIPESTNTTDFTLRVEYSVSNKKKKVISNYIKFQVACINADVDDDTMDMTLDQTMAPDVLNENRFQLKIKGYGIQENFNTKYVICDKALKCKKYNTLITANNVDSKTMMVLDVEGNIYEDSKFTKTFDTFSKVVENYATITYVENNREYTEPVEMVRTGEAEGKVFLLIDRRVIKATSIKLTFRFRNTTYNINLK